MYVIYRMTRRQWPRTRPQPDASLPAFVGACIVMLVIFGAIFALFAAEGPAAFAVSCLVPIAVVLYFANSGIKARMHVGQPSKTKGHQL